MELAQLFGILIQCGIGAECIDTMWLSYGLKMAMLLNFSSMSKRAGSPSRLLMCRHCLQSFLGWRLAAYMHKSNSYHKGTIHYAKSFTNNYKI